MEKVYIASSARTPVGAYDGKLSNYREFNLGAEALKAAVQRAGIEMADISEVIIGIAKQTSGPSNAARYIALDANVPENVPAYTVQRQSLSGIQAVLNGYYKIKCGNAGIIAAGGAESMTTLPFEIQNARYAFTPSTHIVFDPIGALVTGGQPISIYGQVTSMSINSRIASHYGFDVRTQLDYAGDSMRKATEASIDSELITLKHKVKKLVEDVTADELVSEERLIAAPGDAAACCILVGERSQNKVNGLVAEIVAVGLSAGDPSGTGMIGADAVSRALKKASMTMADIDCVEFAELTAAQSLGTIKELRGLGLKNSTRINPNGGALASASAWGAAGSVCLDRLLRELPNGEEKTGLLLCGAEGGQAAAIILKML